MVLLIFFAYLTAFGSGIPIIDARRDYQVRHWTTADGLPKNAIICLAQTPDGILWLGTPDGLVRYDGRVFTVFDRGNLEILNPEHSIHDLLVDRQGALWMSLDRGVARLDDATILPGKKLTPAPFPLTGLASIWSDGRIRFDPRTADHVWLQRSIGGLEFEQVQNHGPGSLAAWSATAEIWFDPLGSLTVSNIVTGASHHHPLPSWKLPSNKNVFLTATPEPDGRWWILHGHNADTESVSLYVWKDGTLTRMATGLPSNGGRTPYLVRDREDAIWFAHEPPGILARFRRGQLDRLSLPTSVNPTVTWCFLEDREGCFWVGTDKSGLYRLEPKGISVISVTEGLPNGNIRTVLADRASVLWAGTDAGVARIDTPADSPAAVGCVAMTNFSVRALAPDEGQNVWAGVSRGLFKTDGTVAQPWALPLINDPIDQSATGSRKIRAMARSDSGALWIASAHAFSVLSPGQVHPRMVGIWAANVGPGGLIIDHAGDVWFGTEGKGVGHILKEEANPVAVSSSLLTTNRVWTGIFGPTLPAFAFTNVEWISTTNGLSSGQVWELFEDSRGVIWIATDNGLNRLDPRPTGIVGKTRASAVGPFRNAFAFHRTHGLPDHQLTALVEDDKGYLWCGSAHGIFRVALDELDAVALGRARRVAARRFGAADGLPSEEISGRWSHPTACRLSDGRLAFATDKGVAVIDPRKLGNTTYGPPLVAVASVSADGELIYANFAAAIEAGIQGLPVATNLDFKGQDELGRQSKIKEVRDAGLPAAASLGSAPKSRSTIHLRLPPDRGRVMEFDFDSPNFQAPGQSRFRYRLDGVDPPGIWQDAQARRVAYYNSLSPGDYRFLVHVRDHHLNESAVPATVEFSIEPSLWQRPSVRIASVAGVLISVGAVVSLRVRRLRYLSELERQNALLRQRTGFARDLHDDIGPRLTQLALLSELAEGSAARTEEVMVARQRISTIARELSAALDGTLGALEPGADSLPAFIDLITDFAEDFVRPSAIELQLDVPGSLADRPLDPLLKRQVFFVVKEAINNAIKHGAASRIRLAVQSSTDGFRVEVSDNGRGFLTADLPHSPARSGLDNMRDRANSIGATLEIESRPGAGTVVRLRVPFNTRPKESGI